MSNSDAPRRLTLVPRRPAFGSYERETVVKEDGRRVHYYTWPDGPARDPSAPLDGGGAGTGESPGRHHDRDGGDV